MSDVSSGAPSDAVRTCGSCGTELARLALACPSCHALVYADQLKATAARAAEQEASGDLTGARASWEAAIQMLPADSRQAESISKRLADLEVRISKANAPGSVREKVAAEGGSWWKQGWAAAIAVGALVLTKGKFLLLGLTKLKTVLSMFAFLGVYWDLYGWQFAAGLVVSIYIHEMGHVISLRRHGIRFRSPLFIPGFGAMIMTERISDPLIDADTGLAGPIYGLGAGLLFLVISLFSGHPTWLALAQFTGWMNLFNLIPVWFLDGNHGMRALDRPMRWGIVVVSGVAFALTGVKMAFAVGLLAVWKAAVSPEERGDVRTFLTFVGLIASLSWMASMDVLR